MTDTYHEGHRLLQSRFDTRRLADRIDGRLVDDMIPVEDKAFIESLDKHTVTFPNYDGNGTYLSAGNVLVDPNVGMLFIDFERGRRLRLNGVASIDEHDELMQHYFEAQFVVRVWAREVFPNCPR